MKTCSLFVFTIVCIVDRIFVQTSPTEPLHIVDEYNVSMTNTGPAFYGSNLTFSAQLTFPASQVPKDTKSFRYEWQSSADHLRESQDADFQTSLTRCFSMIRPGNYSMSLKVFNAKLFNRELVAKATHWFTITRTVNGKLTGTQNGTNSTEVMAFSTQKPVKINLDISDTFMDNPAFTYLWFLGGENETDANETSPTHTFYINETGYHEVKVKVHNGNIVLGCGGFFDTKPSGEFRAQLRLYDPIGAVQVVGKNEVKNTSYVTQVVYFNGSSPFNVSWSFVNVSSGAAISTGQQYKVESSPVTVVLTRKLSIGQYYFNVTVGNPVSQQVRRHNFTVTYIVLSQTVLYQSPNPAYEGKKFEMICEATSSRVPTLFDWTVDSVQFSVGFPKCDIVTGLHFHTGPYITACSTMGTVYRMEILIVSAGPSENGKLWTCNTLGHSSMRLIAAILSPIPIGMKEDGGLTAEE